MEIVIIKEKQFKNILNCVQGLKQQVLQLEDLLKKEKLKGGNSK